MKSAIVRIAVIATIIAVPLWFIAPEDRHWWQELPAHIAKAIEVYRSQGRPPLISGIPTGRASSATTTPQTQKTASQSLTTTTAVSHPPPQPEAQSKPQPIVDMRSLFANFMQPAQEPKPPFMQPVPPKLYKAGQGHGQEVNFGKRKIDGVTLYETVVDLSDPDSFVTIELANNADQANTAEVTHGDETFQSLVKRVRGAVVIDGTFFSKDEQERVMGNMVSRGRFLKYSQWENYGTTIGLKSDGTLEMLTARVDGQPPWETYWFSITCGPRLVKDGQVWVSPDWEGFTDSHVLGIGPRCALGFPRSKDKLYLVTFMSGLSLAQEAKLMKDIGCYQAMNLDGGASRALARSGDILVPAGRPLTNVIVVYDTKHRAPQAVVKSWQRFVEGTSTTASR
ncbi:MAG TPA: phosphodiester glycosidase family protein [Trichormus sp.]